MKIRVRELKKSGLTGIQVQRQMINEGYSISLYQVYNLCKGVADQRHNKPLKFTPEEQAKKNRDRTRKNMRKLRSCPKYRAKVKERNKQYYDQYFISEE